ncbi:hypothetical protein LCGC14_1684800, partial [marine sediment metagenome]
LAASTSEEINRVLWALGGHNDFATGVNTEVHFDIGIGALGSEQVALGDISSRNAIGWDVPTPYAGVTLPLLIPSGSRVSARCQSDGTTSPENQLDLILYGLG